MALLPELLSYLDGLQEPHILFDKQYRILAANKAYRKQFSPNHSVVGRTCYEVSHHFNVPCDQAGESCPLARARESGQRERVLHLHHTPRGEEYVNIELAPLLDAHGEQSFYVEKMQALEVAHGRPVAKGLIGRSPAFQSMLELVARVAPSMASVLLLGESGTGKELVAQALHEASERSRKPFVVVDCSSIPETLFESEIFGHERGAFTGATNARGGLVESASGGTLFLDEAGDIPLTMQVKLLRLLETGTYRRVGSTELRRADIRVVSATHRNLAEMIAAGTFREDLYYRLGTFPIHLPPLRDRKDDIPLLSAALLERIDSKRRLQLSEAAQSYLKAQPFYGNVRELRNLLEHGSILCDGEILEPAHLQKATQSGVQKQVTPRAVLRGMETVSRSEPSKKTLKAVEEEAFKALVSAHRGSRTELARSLGISTRSLYRKLKACSLES